MLINIENIAFYSDNFNFEMVKKLKIQYLRHIWLECIILSLPFNPTLQYVFKSLITHLVVKKMINEVISNIKATLFSHSLGGSTIVLSICVVLLISRSYYTAR